MPGFPLKGLVVLDLTRLIPGPFCSLVLSDLGAQVIKVEDKSRGDYLKNFPPVLPDGEGVLYHALNRGKKKVVVGLKSSEGRAAVKKLAKKADVLLESFRPGVMDRLGLGFESVKRINPKIVYASISGYGQSGPQSNAAGHDLNYLSVAGLVDSSEMPVIQWADLVGGGLWGALSIVTALYHRRKTKKGIHLDISMTDSMIFLGLSRLVLSQTKNPFGILSGDLARYRIYRTKDDAFMALAALEDKFWSRFCEIVGRPQWKGEGGVYPDRAPQIHNELAGLFHSKTRQEWVDWAKEHDVCLTPVFSPEEVLESAQFLARRFFVKEKFGSKEWIFPKIPLR